MRLTPEELQALISSPDVEQYEAVCQVIQNRRGGEYPRDWYEMVMAPGRVHDLLAAEWGKPDAFKVTVPSDAATAELLGLKPRGLLQ